MQVNNNSPTRQTVRKLMSIWLENLICNWYAVRSVYWSNSDQKCTFSPIKQNFQHNKPRSNFFFDISQHFDMKMRNFLKSIWYQFLQSKKRALFQKNNFFIIYLKRRGWCGRLYSLPIVTSSPLTIVQWQESATGTHTLLPLHYGDLLKNIGQNPSIYIVHIVFFKLFLWAQTRTNW
jgi:hypothetical protein